MRLLLCKNWFTSPVISPLLYTRCLSAMTNAASFPIAPQAPPTWSFTPTDIGGKTTEIIDKSNKFYELMSQVESPSVTNFIEPFMKFENELGPIINRLTFLQHVSSDKEIRDASVDSSMKLDELNIDLSLRHDIFLQFARVWQDAQPKADSLKKETFKYIEKSYKDFIHSGLELDEANRLKIKEIKKKISMNSINFSRISVNRRNISLSPKSNWRVCRTPSWRSLRQPSPRKVVKTLCIKLLSSTRTFSP
ncbi:PRD1-like protein [Saccharomyces kudriavzevii IFO 1802]|uniref:PRD1-like protein n=1 Tax=Saccharomyces kudriavzevii (strain ATCC MYA-4449 / AS 2.2408 / CBS 8840 / NBRC 1802 / NCYC 2889) TaxID=226230 RepID=J5PLX0_SACK1|nr:PRD1-like protein [Saccharomyces kudriavzevii IFO 1802]